MNLRKDNMTSASEMLSKEILETEAQTNAAIQNMHQKTLDYTNHTHN
jgi:hypothetical protein